MLLAISYGGALRHALLSGVDVGSILAVDSSYSAKLK